MFDKRLELCIDRNGYLVLECLLEVLEFLLVDFVSTRLAICFHVCDVYDLFVSALAHQWKNRLIWLSTVAVVNLSRS